MKIVHFAFGQREDLHACKVETLVDTGNVRLIAGQAVKRFGNDDLKTACQSILEKLLNAGTQERRAGLAVIGVAVVKSPAVLIGALLANADLILDRGGALHVGRVSGVNGNFGHESAPALSKDIPPDFSTSLGDAF